MNKNLIRPFSSNFESKKKGKRRKIDYGKTALLKAEKSFKEWKFRKDSELFSSLQHRINDEYLKFKTSNNFYTKDSRINHAVELIKEKRKFSRMESQIKNNEKFQNHSNLYTIQNEIKMEKIRQYEMNYRKKEQKSKLIREKELAKRNQKEKEYPKEEILRRMDVIKEKEKMLNNKLRLKLKNKDLYLKKFKEEGEKICQMRKINLENFIKERKYRIDMMHYEQDNLRGKKRKEIEKRNDDINNFLFEKELINEQKININDKNSIRYQNYKSRIDNILYKRDFDKKVLNKIKFMTSLDPTLSGLGKNLYN